MPQDAGAAADARQAMAEVPDNHGMFLYESDEEFVDRITSFLGAGTADGEAGLAVLSPRKWSLLQEALGAEAERIRHLPRESIYTRPQATLAEYDAILRGAVEEGAPALRLLGELPVSDGQEQCHTWALYEAALNRVFADRPALLLCGYDLREQPAAAVASAWHTHPLVLAGGWEDNRSYRDPASVARESTGEPRALVDLSELPLDAEAKGFSARLRRELQNLRLPKAQTENVLRAALEVFANAGAHGRGARSQRLGRVEGLVVWELSDNGSGFDEPLAGYLPPQPGDSRGSGLWVARQLTERVEFLTSPHGFTTRLWIRA
jgi:hypothetical protein